MGKTIVFLVVLTLALYIAFGYGVLQLINYVAEHGLRDIGTTIWCGKHGC
jgi:hypothetical protein